MDRKLHRCNPCYFCAYVTSWTAWEKRSRWRLPSHRKNVEPSRNYTTLCCPSSSQCPSDPCKTMSRSDLIYRIYSAGQELQRLVKAIPPCFFSASTRLHHYGSWFKKVTSYLNQDAMSNLKTAQNHTMTVSQHSRRSAAFFLILCRFQQTPLFLMCCGYWLAYGKANENNSWKHLKTYTQHKNTTWPLKWSVGSWIPLCETKHELGAYVE